VSTWRYTEDIGDGSYLHSRAGHPQHPVVDLPFSSSYEPSQIGPWDDVNPLPFNTQIPVISPEQPSTLDDHAFRNAAIESWSRRLREGQHLHKPRLPRLSRQTTAQPNC
jgi:hypothetical protein